MRIDQIPDSRRAILEVLKQRGPATISRLSTALDLTGEAIRQQLLQLRRDGWVEPSETEKSRIGRPAATYRLTREGDHLFPKRYDDLLLAVLDAASAELGPQAPGLLARISGEIVKKHEPSVRGLPVEQRIEKMKDYYTPADGYMSIERRGGTACLVQRNCPFYNTAMMRPAICSVTVNALTRLIGARVERKESFQSGDGHCAFYVHADQPVSADLPFEPEAPKLVRA